MVLLAAFESRHGLKTSIQFDVENLATLVREGQIDAYIVSTEEGFSPLGAALTFLSSDLGIPENEIRHHAKWNRFENPRVSLVALRSRRPDSLLRGAILAPSESSVCYKQFAVPFDDPPFRDFYYNVTYEAIAFASENWGACHLALSHLSGSGNFHEEIAVCNAEALANYCDATPSAELDSFTFTGCCISLKHLGGIARMNDGPKTTQPHQISKETAHHDGYVLVNLLWD